MRVIYSMLLCFVCFAAPLKAQNRSQLSVMIMPDTTAGLPAVLEKVATDNAYRAVTAKLTSALLENGYRNTQDAGTHLEQVRGARWFTSDSTLGGDKMRLFIESAPADILIAPALHWMEAPDGRPYRRLQLYLKAVDKYTGNVYADALLQSKERAFSNLEEAAHTTLTIDGKEAFVRFLTRLDKSYEVVMKEGRPMDMQFEISLNSGVRLSDRVGQEGRRISELIEACVREKALNGQYKVVGVSASYMHIIVQAPVIDAAGRSVTPENYLGNGVEDCSYRKGVQMRHVARGALLKFIL